MGYYRSVHIAFVERPDLPPFSVPLNMDAAPDFTEKGKLFAATKAFTKKYPAAYFEAAQATGDKEAFRVMVGGLPAGPARPGSPLPKSGAPVLATLRFSFDRVKS